MTLDGVQCLVSRAAGTETVGAVLEVRLEYRLQNQHPRRLRHAITYRRDAQRALTPIGLGDVHALYGLRLVGLGPQSIM